MSVATLRKVRDRRRAAIREARPLYLCHWLGKPVFAGTPEHSAMNRFLAERAGFGNGGVMRPDLERKVRT